MYLSVLQLTQSVGMDPARNFWRGAPRREALNLMNYAHESRFNARRRRKF